MLGFIQRYQKIIFSIVAVVISISFLFFGILPKGGGGSVVDKVAYVASNKTKIKRSKYEGLKAMILTHCGEDLVYGKALGPHFFQESFFVADLLKPGLLQLIARENEKDLKSSFEAKLKQERKYKTYAHPEAPFLNAENIWALHAPNLNTSLNQLRAETDPLKAFELKLGLYLEETSFTPFTLWQVLSEQQEHFSWIPKDPTLNPEKLELFGYHSPQDWLGEEMVEKSLEFVCETIMQAKQLGYRITTEEAEKDLMAQNKQNFMRIKSLGIRDIQDEEAYFNMKLARLGMDKVQMISLWKDLLLFRRFFEEASNSALLDTKTLAQFESQASQTKALKKFYPPRELQFSSLRDLAHLEVYLEALGKPLHQLDLKFKQKPIEEIAKVHPQFVQQELEITFKETSVRKAALNIKAGEIWEYKLDPQNFERLSAQFPPLLDFIPKVDADYQDKMEQLPSHLTAQIDYYIKEQLLEKKEDWKTQALSYSEPKTLKVFMKMNGHGLPFEGIEVSDAREEFLSQLFQIDPKKIFSFDEEHFYQVEKIESLSAPQLVAYETLKNQRVLDKMLLRKLQALHTGETEVERLSKTAQEKLIGQFVEPLQEAILKDYLSCHKKTDHEVDTDFYCAYRLYNPMRAALNYLKDHAKDEDQYAFNSIWTLKGGEQTCIRYLADQDEVDHYLSLKEGQWSAIHNDGGVLSFAHALKASKTPYDHPMQKQMKRKIKQELTEALALEILEQMHQDIK